jgi:glycine/D-amino acid oxidase-like deaminating enzyme
VNRRDALKGVALTAGSLLLEGCSQRRARSPVPSPAGARLQLPKVLVSPEREIRTIAGLRPFRPSGFRVATEKVGDQLCVHNYGHGGAGITLSWGTARLASEAVRASGYRQVAVAGCGVVGLSTARLLQQMGMDVTIYAKALPPDTTSNVAGGLWDPFSVFDEDRVSSAFREQFMSAVRFAHTYFQAFAGDEYGVHWRPVYFMSQTPIPETDMLGPQGFLRGLLPEMRDLSPEEHAFPFPYVRTFRSMLIEPHPYLRALMRDFRLAGGRIVVQEFHAVQELARLAHPVVVNCTGLGARALFGDDEMLPIKGQLTFLLPQPEIDYLTLAGNLYMFPRRDGILLGGTFVRGDWSLEPDPVAKDRILRGHADMFRGWS